MSLIAFYDLDRTVTRLPTWSAFLLYSAARRAPWRLASMPLVLLPWLAHRMGLLSRDRLKEVMHALLLGRTMPIAGMARLSERFADRTVAMNIRPGARARIQADRREGFRIVLATAAHRFYAEPIARRLGIEDVIATEGSTVEDDVITHRLGGANVYGSAKLAAVRSWLAANASGDDAPRLRFYSDHGSDEPLLEFVDEPYAVNPSDALRRLAIGRGWPILDWNGSACEGVERT